MDELRLVTFARGPDGLSAGVRERQPLDGLTLTSKNNTEVFAIFPVTLEFLGITVARRRSLANLDFS